MSIEELFLRQIDSIDGNIEVTAHPGQDMTCVSTGPFVWQVENADRDAVIERIGAVMADPDGKFEPFALASGETLDAWVFRPRDLPPTLWIGSGPTQIRLSLGTASLLVAALCEAREWQRKRILAASGEGVATC